jgi:hypothetical protein
MIFRPAFAVLAFAILLYPGASRADEVRPSSYDECITDTMKGVSSDVAANAIITSCRNLFPEQVNVAPVPVEPAPEPETSATQQEASATKETVVAAGTSRGLTPEELGNLKATALVMADSYRVTFTNDNEHLTVTEVTISVGDDSGPDGPGRYSKKVQIAPLTSGVAHYKVPYEGNGFDLDLSEATAPSWRVVAAEGTDLR